MKKSKTVRENIETLKEKALVVEKLLKMLEKEIKKKDFSVLIESPANGTLTNKVVNDYTQNAVKLATIYKNINELEKNNPEQQLDQRENLFKV